MAKKKGLYGVSVYVKNKPRKRTGRHAKRFNKRKTSKKREVLFERFVNGS